MDTGAARVRRVTASAVLVFGFYTAVKAAFLSTVFSTVVEERNLIYLAPLCFIAMALALERGRSAGGHWRRQRASSST